MPMVASSGAMRVTLKRPQSEALDHQAEQGAHRQHDRDRDRQWRVEMRDRQEAGIGAHDIDRAVGEIDQAAHAEDQGKPHRQQRIDVADDDAVQRVVEPGSQRFLDSGRQRTTGPPSYMVNLPFLTTRSTLIAPETRRVCGSNVALPKITLGTSFTFKSPSWMA
jgi:hypothetical protein